MLEMVKGPVPVFCKVTACGALDCPTMVDGKVSEVGLKFTVGVPVPVPVMSTVWGELGAVSVKISVAEVPPVTTGEKVTLITQEAEGASDAPQVFPVMVYRVGLLPPLVMLVMLKEAVPVFVTVNVCTLEVVPTIWFPNTTLVGLKLIAPCAPDPVMGTV